MDMKPEVINIQLPYNAQFFIKSKFLKVNIVYLEKIDSGYKVELDNDISITFDENGNWTSINSNKKIPEYLVPKPVKEKITKLKMSDSAYKSKSFDINEIRRIINSYRVIINHYLEMHIYNNR